MALSQCKKGPMHPIKIPMLGTMVLGTTVVTCFYFFCGNRWLWSHKHATKWSQLKMLQHR